MNDTTTVNKESKDSISLLILILLATQVIFQGITLWRLFALENRLGNEMTGILQSNLDDVTTLPDNTVVQQVSLGFNPPRGDVNAPITIVEFSDFSCPYCKESAQLLRELIDSNPGKIQLYYRHLIVYDSFRAALAVECASKQNRFWEMHDALFESAPDFSENRLLNIRPLA